MSIESGRTYTDSTRSHQCFSHGPGINDLSLESLASGGAHGEVEARRFKPHIVVRQPCACLMEHHADRTYPEESLLNLKNSGLSGVIDRS
jgi:hypothetical protein